MRTRYAGMWAALALVALGGCGPTPQEIGGLMIVGLAPTVWVAAALNYALYRLWRRSREELDPPTAVEAIAAGGIALLFAAVVAVTIVGNNEDLVAAAFWLVGTAYLTPMVVAIGIALRGRRRSAFRYLWWAPAPAVIALALPLVVDAVGNAYVDTALQTLVVVGGLGIVGGGLFLVLLGFSLRAWARARRAAGGPRPLEF